MSQNFDIDLRILIREFISQRKILFLLFLFFMLSSLFLYNFRENQFEASLIIEPLSTIEIEKYQNLFDFNDYLKKTDDNTSEINEESPISHPLLFNITSSSFQDLLIAELQDRNEIINFINKTEMIDKTLFENEEDYSAAVIDLSYNFKILPAITTEETRLYNSDYQKNLIIKFISEDQKSMKTFFEFVLTNANENVRQKLIDKKNLMIKSFKTIKNYRIEDIDRKILNLRKLHDYETELRLEFLKDQANIARKLNIVSGQMQSVSFQDDGKFNIAAIDTDQPYYMRGFVSIDEEILSIKTRDNPDLHIHGLEELKILRKGILEDPLIQRFENIINASPISNKNKFTAATYSLNNINYEKIGLRNLYILLIGILFYFLVSILYLIVRLVAKNI